MKTPKITKEQAKKLILPSIIILQFAIMAVLAWFVYWNHVATNETSTLRISGLIVKAVEALTWPVNADPQTGRLYIHEAHLTLPTPPDQSYGIYYNYIPAFDGSPEEVHLMDKQDVNMQKNTVQAVASLEEVFNAVPKLQACARGYTLTFAVPKNQDPNTSHQVFTKKLKDQRDLYAYLDNDCAQSEQQMVPYLKQIESY